MAAAGEQLSRFDSAHMARGSEPGSSQPEQYSDAYDDEALGQIEIQDAE